MIFNKYFIIFNKFFPSSNPMVFLLIKIQICVKIHNLIIICSFRTKILIILKIETLYVSKYTYCVQNFASTIILYSAITHFFHPSL